MVGAAIGAVHAVGALLTSRTFFQPDEYWQSLEIAHRIVFGYGYRTWEWTSDPPLRSIVHPALFVPLYKLLDITGASAYALATAPAMQQALMSALGDWFAYRLIARTAGRSVALVWCVLHLGSVYWLYTASRPFSNTMEAALCSIALYYWPMSRARVLHVSRTHHTYRIALLAAWAAVLVRPTSVILWSFLGLQVLYDAWHTACCGRLLLDAVWTGAAALAIGAGLDTLYYGTWTWTPLAFVRTKAYSLFTQGPQFEITELYGKFPSGEIKAQGNLSLKGLRQENLSNFTALMNHAQAHVTYQIPMEMAVDIFEKQVIGLLLSANGAVGDPKGLESVAKTARYLATSTINDYVGRHYLTLNQGILNGQIDWQGGKLLLNTIPYHNEVENIDQIYTPEDEKELEGPKKNLPQRQNRSILRGNNKKSVPLKRDAK